MTHSENRIRNSSEAAQHIHAEGVSGLGLEEAGDIIHAVRRAGLVFIFRGLRSYRFGEIRSSL